MAARPVEAPAARRRSLRRALRGRGLAVIAEVKRRSPSAGSLADDLDAADQARRYVEGGAAAVSVLTEPEFFAGSLDDLRAVRRAVTVPILRKDFLLHPAQVAEAAAAGADAVLLIAAIVDDDVLGALIAEARRLGLDALVEVHDEAEVARALGAGADLVGVNNRDLTTFEVDLGVAERLANLLPDDVVRVAESGVSDVRGARRMAAAGYDAILVGEAAVRAEDPAAFVAALGGAR